MSSHSAGHSSDGSTPMPKSLFGYEVLDHIGVGAASTIYLVSHPQTNQIYALKYVVRKTDKDERFIQQLEAESEVGKSIVMKRFATRGRGKSTRILKPFSRLRIVVREQEEA